MGRIAETHGLRVGLPMIAEDFEELVATCVQSGFSHRMLYVFVRAAFMENEELADEQAGVVQVLFDAHQPVQPGLTFADLRQTADAQNPDWNIVIVALAKNSDASLPSDEQAVSFLADMREKVLVGDIGHFSLLDRDGQPLDIQTDVVDDGASASPYIN